MSRHFTLALCAIGTIVLCLSPSLAETSSAVAKIEVDGHSVVITAERLQAYVDGNPEKDVRVCLQELIDFELLAQDARRRGLAEKVAIQHAVRQAQVRMFLGEDFAPTWTAESMPKEYVEQAYQKNYNMFNKPESRDADHVITTIESKRPTDPETDLKAQAMAQAIYEEMKLNPPKDRTDFIARGAVWEERAKEQGFEVRAQPLGRFGKAGRFAPSFTEKVFEHEGDAILVPPFVTEFGHHVVRIEKSYPEIARTIEDAETEIRARIKDQVRGQKLRELTDRLASEQPPIAAGKGVNALMNAGYLYALEQRKGLVPANAVDPKGSKAP